jgi:hypothetical protein
MKTLSLLVAVIGLGGCVAVPVFEPPGVYVAPPAPAVIVRPYRYDRYGYHGQYRRDRRPLWHRGG